MFGGDLFQTACMFCRMASAWRSREIDVRTTASLSGCAEEAQVRSGVVRYLSEYFLL